MELSDEQIEAIAQKIAKRVLDRLPAPGYYTVPTLPPPAYPTYYYPPHRIWC